MIDPNSLVRSDKRSKVLRNLGITIFLFCMRILFQKLNDFALILCETDGHLHICHYEKTIQVIEQ